MIDSINTYVVENFGAVQLEEMVHQIHDILSERTDFSMSKEMGLAMVEHHIKHHVRHQKVILNTVLNDLLRLSHVTKCASVVECQETGGQSVDSKMLNTYLKIVDHIITVYRMDSMKGIKSLFKGVVSRKTDSLSPPSSYFNTTLPFV